MQQPAIAYASVRRRAVSLHLRIFASLTGVTSQPNPCNERDLLLASGGQGWTLDSRFLRVPSDTTVTFLSISVSLALHAGEKAEPADIETSIRIGC